MARIRYRQNTKLSVIVEQRIKADKTLSRELIEEGVKKSRPKLLQTIGHAYQVMKDDIVRLIQHGIADGTNSISTVDIHTTHLSFKTGLTNTWEPLDLDYLTRKVKKDHPSNYWINYGDMTASIAAVVNASDSDSGVKSGPIKPVRETPKGWVYELKFELDKFNDPFLDYLVRGSFAQAERVPISFALENFQKNSPITYLPFFEVPGGKRPQLFRPLLGDVAAAHGRRLEVTIKKV